jgi:phenylacetate-coenzyme A ligase PaaK-like adenylate-forming protein
MAFDKLQKLLDTTVYGLGQQIKEKIFIDAMREVSIHHYNNCKPYRNLCDKRGFNPNRFLNITEIPYLSTSLFKDVLLLSIEKDQVFREIHSSATTSGRSSRIGIDKETSRRQTKCFNKVVVDRIGQDRRKFIILDVPSSVGRDSVASARSSTIRSLLFCASEYVTCINETNGKLSLDEDKLRRELREAENSGEPVVIFGFTFVLYSLVLRRLLDGSIRYKLPGSKIVHIGGWKKLEAEKVSPEKLVTDCSEVFGVPKSSVIDFYGFTEQAGLIYPTCEEGVRHAPFWVEIIVRDPLTLEPLPEGKEGLMQFITPIQTSYPGHSVLTDDIGSIIGVDGCNCGRKGTTFKIIGRAANAEVRGCGDIMAEKFA